jgi:peroxiredoxin
MASQNNESVGVEVGQLAPDFAALDLDEKPTTLKSITSGRKSLLIFYRGGWCPFCNEQLGAIAKDYARFQDSGTTIVAVSGEGVQKGKELLKKLCLPFTLLSDPNFEAIDRYGVRNSDISERMIKAGITRLPKPSAFIIDKAGILRYKYIGKDAPDRPKNEDLLKVLIELGKSSESPDSERELEGCQIRQRS